MIGEFPRENTALFKANVRLHDLIGRHMFGSMTVYYHKQAADLSCHVDQKSNAAYRIDLHTRPPQACLDNGPII
jgi:hypothetical protein